MALTPDQQRRMRMRRMNLLMAYASFASSKAVAWTPAELFAQGEQGVWYDPSDFSTLFQDAAGTTPVTAVEQPVGLMLDKSKGLVLSGEKLVNGNFSSASNWTLPSGATITNDTLVYSSVASTFGAASGPATGGVNFSSNTWFKVTLKVDAITAGQFRVSINGGSYAFVPASAGTHTIYVLSGTSTNFYFRIIAAGTTSGVIDTVTVFELPGNHAFQSTSAARPVLSARVNLLTKTEEFDNAVWTKLNATVTANAAVAPDGTMTADKLVENTTTSAHIARQSIAFPDGAISATWVIKAAERTQAFLRLESGGAFANRFDAVVNLSDGSTVTATNLGTFTGSLTSVGLGDGWFRFSFNGNTGVRGGDGNMFYTVASALSGAQSYLGDGTSGIYLWGADLRVSNVGVNLPAYQRVNTSTDYDTTGFPYYLRFDGTDDSLATATINPGSVDKVQVFAGVRKLSDAAQGVVAEWSADIASNNGTFLLAAPDGATATFGFDSKGTTQVDAVASSQTAPLTAVLSGIADISGDIATIRVNGAQVDQDTGDQGTGNFLSYPLYIGRRNGTTLPFNGHLYSLIVRFSATNLPDATIAQTETWVNGKTGAY